MHFTDVLCDYFCWIIGFEGASRLFWLSIGWFLSELIIRIIARKNSVISFNTQSAELKDQGSWAVIVVSSLLMASLILSVLHFRWSPDLSNKLFPLGIALMVIGTAIRIWAVMSLGKFFTMSVMIFSNHHIVENGPYRFLRHPSYLGVLLIAIGFGLASGYLAVFLIFFILLVITLGYRIFIEEKALKDKFGEEWIAYSQKTWKILPWIL